MNEFQIVHRDDMETNGNWTLCRRALDLGSLGMGLVEIAAGDSIPAHDETERDQEEVFIVLSGTPVLVIDDQEHPAPEGTFARIDPALRRHVMNPGPNTAQVLIVSAPRTSGYEPMGWN